MSLLYGHSFDYYQKDHIDAGQWSNLPTSSTMYDIVAGEGRCGTQCLEMNDGFIVKGVTPTGTSGWSGIAVNPVQPSGAFSGNQPVCIVYQAGLQLITFYRALDGSIFARRPDGLSPIWTLGGGDSLRMGVYDFGEFKWTVAGGTSGMVGFRRNGDPNSETIITGIDTQGVGIGSGWQGVGMGASIGSLMHYDDFVIGDMDGAAPWNDWLGNTQVERRFININGAMTDWPTVVGSTAADAVADPDNPDDDTTYIESDTAGDIDTFTLDPSAASGVTVWGVQFTIDAECLTPASRAVAAVVRQSSVNYPGSDLYVTEGYSMVQECMQANPATGNAWLDTEVESPNEFGPKLSI